MIEVLEFDDPNALARVVGVICFAAGGWLGSWFPDIDRIAVLRLRHRSTVTHACAAPVLAIVAARASGNEWAGWVTAGFAAGVGLHLAFDLFPGKWRGFALVDVPKLGRCTKTVSVVWLFANVFVCTGLAVSTVAGARYAQFRGMRRSCGGSVSLRGGEEEGAFRGRAAADAIVVGRGRALNRWESLKTEIRGRLR